MDRIRKFLKLLSVAERKRILDVLSHIEAGSLEELDVRKLKGVPGLFRVRIGSIRIIFDKDGDEIRIIAIERRSEGTYKDL